MKKLMPVGTKVEIKVGDNAGNTGMVYAVHPEDAHRPYDIMVTGTYGEVWTYGATEVAQLDS